MQAVTVYRVDYTRKTKVAIGSILELRKIDRTRNYTDLLRLARQVFALNAEDALRINIDASQARVACHPDREIDLTSAVNPR